MWTVSRSILIALLLVVASFAPANAILIDLIADAVTWHMDPFTQPVSFSTHMVWDTVTQQMNGGSHYPPITTTGLSRYDPLYYLVFESRLTNRSTTIALEGILGAAPGAPAHGYSFIYWALPTELGVLQPGTYDATQSLFYWSSVSNDPVRHPEDGFHIEFAPAASGHTIVSVPTPALTALLPRRVDLSPILRRVNPVLQDISATGATAILRALGRPAQQRATREGPWNAYMAYIDLPAFSVQVGSYCSGLWFLVTLALGAVVLAAEMRRSLARRFVLVGLAVILALGANIIRVVALSLGVEGWGESITHGLPHLGIAWALWGVAMLILMTGAVILGRRAKSFTE